MATTERTSYRIHGIYGAVASVTLLVYLRPRSSERRLKRKPVFG